jgi:hypothetical protein
VSSNRPCRITDEWCIRRRIRQLLHLWVPQVSNSSCLAFVGASGVWLIYQMGVFYINTDLCSLLLAMLDKLPDSDESEFIIFPPKQYTFQTKYHLTPLDLDEVFHICRIASCMVGTPIIPGKEGGVDQGGDHQMLEGGGLTPG